MLVHDRGYLITAQSGGGFAFFRPDGAGIPPSPALPPPDGTIGDCHDAASPRARSSRPGTASGSTSTTPSTPAWPAPAPRRNGRTSGTRPTTPSYSGPANGSSKQPTGSSTSVSTPPPDRGRGPAKRDRSARPRCRRVHDSYVGADTFLLVAGLASLCMLKPDEEYAGQRLAREPSHSGAAHLAGWAEPGDPGVGMGAAGAPAGDQAPGRVGKVKPHYTSQRWSACGQADRDSRESQAVFRWTACGFAGHGDVNAAKNMAGARRDCTGRRRGSPAGEPRTSTACLLNRTWVAGILRLQAGEDVNPARH